MNTSHASVREGDVGRNESNASMTPLVAALESYLMHTRDVDAIRAAIARWCSDVEQASLEPQALLVQFKQALDSFGSAEHPLRYEQWLDDRREIILMCIQEFYRDAH